MKYKTLHLEAGMSTYLDALGIETASGRKPFSPTPRTAIVPLEDYVHEMHRDRVEIWNRSQEFKITIPMNRVLCIVESD